MGSSGFKIFRLLSALAVAIHIFACAFYRVVLDHRTPEEVQSLLEAKGASPDVSSPSAHTAEMMLQLRVTGLALCHQITMLIGANPVLMQDLAQAYVRTFHHPTFCLNNFFQSSDSGVASFFFSSLLPYI
jgi:hypothetical protein